jgi:hypothetical protein
MAEVPMGELGCGRLNHGPAELSFYLRAHAAARALSKRKTRAFGMCTPICPRARTLSQRSLLPPNVGAQAGAAQIQQASTVLLTYLKSWTRQLFVITSCEATHTDNTDALSEVLI